MFVPPCWPQDEIYRKMTLYRMVSQGCKRDLSLRDWDETETFGFWSGTRPRPRPSCNSTRQRRDRDVWFLSPDETETKTLQGQDRDMFRDLQSWTRMHTQIPLFYGIKIVSVVQRIHGETGCTISDVQQRDEQTDRQTDKNSTFCPPRRRLTSEPHQTWHGDLGRWARCCASITFGGPT